MPRLGAALFSMVLLALLAASAPRAGSQSAREPNALEGRIPDERDSRRGLRVELASWMLEEVALW